VRDRPEAPREVFAWAAIEPHPFAELAGEDPEAVLLYLVQPYPAGWQLDSGRKARQDEVDRKETRVHNGRPIRQNYLELKGPRAPV
jgi:hypothetical protein